MMMKFCFLFIYLMTTFATIVNAHQNHTIPIALASQSIIKSNNNRYDEKNDHHRLLKSSSSNSMLTFISTLTASNGEANHLFGNENAVAISNNRIVVGSPYSNNHIGSAYVFMDPNNPSTGRSYSQMAILTAGDGLASYFFGRSVAIDGDIIVVGAPLSVPKGAVYVFRIQNNNNISQMAKIWAGEYFGDSVAVHGKFILVGASAMWVNGLRQVGSAYLFVNPSNDLNNHEWTQIMQFQPNDLVEYNHFGYSVAMDDRVAVIGTYNADAYSAYVFGPIDGNVDLLSSWTQTAKLTGPMNSYFGDSLAVAVDTIVMGGSDNFNGINAGAVFVFRKIDGSSSTLSWTETTKLLAADGAEYDFFGKSVSISKDASTIVVGANGVDYNSTIYDSGAVYLFRNTDSTWMTTGWTQVGKFVAADRDMADGLGMSIAIENSVVVVGAPGDDTTSGEQAGSAYVLDTGSSPSTVKPSPAIPWNKIFPLAASGTLVLGFLVCLLP